MHFLISLEHRGESWVTAASFLQPVKEKKTYHTSFFFFFFPHVHQLWQRGFHTALTFFFVFCFFFPLPCLSHMIFWLNCLSLPASTSVLSPTVYVALLSGRLYVRKCLFSLATSTAKNIFSPIEQRGEKTGGRELMRKRKEELFYIKQAREAQACGLRAFVETLGGWTVSTRR